MIQIPRFPVLCLLLAGLTACTGADQKIDYENSVVTPALEIPPDLIRRSQTNGGKNGGNSSLDTPSNLSDN